MIKHQRWSHPHAPLSVLEHRRLPHPYVRRRPLHPYVCRLHPDAPKHLGKYLKDLCTINLVRHQWTVLAHIFLKEYDHRYIIISTLIRISPHTFQIGEIIGKFKYINKINPKIYNYYFFLLGLTFFLVFFFFLLPTIFLKDCLALLKDGLLIRSGCICCFGDTGIDFSNADITSSNS
jgi:hypothetical protein